MTLLRLVLVALIGAALWGIIIAGLWFHSLLAMAQFGMAVAGGFATLALVNAFEALGGQVRR